MTLEELNSLPWEDRWKYIYDNGLLFGTLTLPEGLGCLFVLEIDGDKTRKQVETTIERQGESIYAEIVLNKARSKVISISCDHEGQDDLANKYESELMKLLRP